MDLPNLHFVVCGRPFDSPYEELIEGCFPDGGPVNHITPEQLEARGVPRL
jgi:hypothetical protein